MPKKDPIIEILAPSQATAAATSQTFQSAVIITSRLPLITDDQSRRNAYKGDNEYGDWHV
jgi:hypothetical protein